MNTDRIRRGKGAIVGAFVLFLVEAVVLGIFTTKRFESSDQFPWVLGLLIAIPMAVYVWGCSQIAKAKGRGSLSGLAGLAFPFGLVWLFECPDRFESIEAGIDWPRQATAVAKDSVAPDTEGEVPTGTLRYVCSHPMCGLGLALSVAGGFLLLRRLWAHDGPTTMGQTAFCWGLLGVGLVLLFWAVGATRQNLRYLRRIRGTVLNVGLIEPRTTQWILVGYQLAGGEAIPVRLGLPPLEQGKWKAGDAIDLLVDARLPGTCHYDPKLAALLPLSDDVALPTTKIIPNRIARTVGLVVFSGLMIVGGLTTGFAMFARWHIGHVEQTPTSFTAERFASAYNGRHFLTVTGFMAYASKHVEPSTHQGHEGKNLAYVNVPLVPPGWSPTEPVHIVVRLGPMDLRDAERLRGDASAEAAITGTISPIENAEQKLQSCFPSMKVTSPVVFLNPRASAADVPALVFAIVLWAVGCCGLYLLGRGLYALYFKR